ncbi:MAG TPA: hypothetical protein VEG30_07080 [Terriglobales bacterium]|nr:hypothetical protein [Terriglobales bacterium]
MTRIRSVVFVLLTCLLTGLTSRAADKPANLDKFAQCLSQKKATMYGLFWCTHCKDQKDLFGDSFRFVPYVECGIPGSRGETQQCKDLGIKKTPTWIFSDGEHKEGLLQLKDLSSKTGCTLP